MKATNLMNFLAIPFRALVNIYKQKLNSGVAKISFTLFLLSFVVANFLAHKIPEHLAGPFIILAILFIVVNYYIFLFSNQKIIKCY